MSVISLEKQLYEAKCFEVDLRGSKFIASGTLCGHVDFVVPRRGTYTLNPYEILKLTKMLQEASEDVLSNSDPEGDPRLYDPK
jgi:hypothetical protein